MEDKECVVIATIIRGLSLNAIKYPWIVAYERGEKTVPSDALVVDIALAFREGVIDEEAAAKVFLEAYTAWEFDKAPGGIEAAMMQDPVKKIPSCIVVRHGENSGAGEVFYWIDRDIDAMRRRMQAGSGSVLEEKLPQNTAFATEVKFDAADRANVVNHKVALLVGDTRDTAVIARSLAASGALVFIADMAQDAAAQLANAINTSARRTAAIPVPVASADEHSVEALFNTIVETTGGLDLCIYHDSALRQGSVLEQTLEAFQALDTLFFLIAKYAGLLLKRQARTALTWKTDIIHINHGRLGAKLEKVDAQGLIASFVHELAAYSIKVNVVSPGNYFELPFWTDPETGLFAQDLKTGKLPGVKSIAEVRAFYEARVLLKRGCTAQDIMRAIFYVIEQDYETGRVLPVSGGQG
ncbi:MAG: SDR family oxidoreductase [Treponema sp.]|nr:SDR family oxidoreductase [Treponema sp.]